MEAKQDTLYLNERGPFERLFNMIPESVRLDDNKGIPYLIRDYFAKWPNYTKVLYCSLDYQNLILFVLFFSLFDRITGNSIISIGIIYIIERMLRWLRAYLAENNLAKKTLIDDCFLI